ncbi:MAG: iron-containing alcohol dehydrogenase, partial [Candidatus Bathyarchaeota archaeon]|nr:iron-containing alcohol dehydrogenase [Candidatus Bathyarchaeota archaeon]
MSSNLHRMQLPREIVVGNGSLDLVSDICMNLDLSKSALVIADLTTMRIAGRKVTSLLQDEEMEVNCHIISSKAATLRDVRHAEEKIKKINPQLIFGVGGGTVIDIAK